MIDFKRVIYWLFCSVVLFLFFSFAIGLYCAANEVFNETSFIPYILALVLTQISISIFFFVTLSQEIKELKSK